MLLTDEEDEALLAREDKVMMIIILAREDKVIIKAMMLDFYDSSNVTSLKSKKDQTKSQLLLRPT